MIMRDRLKDTSTPWIFFQSVLTCSRSLNMKTGKNIIWNDFATIQIPLKKTLERVCKIFGPRPNVHWSSLWYSGSATKATQKNLQIVPAPWYTSPEYKINLSLKDGCAGALVEPNRSIIDFAWRRLWCAR